MPSDSGRDTTLELTYVYDILFSRIPGTIHPRREQTAHPGALLLAGESLEREGGVDFAGLDAAIAQGGEEVAD